MVYRINGLKYQYQPAEFAKWLQDAETTVRYAFDEQNGGRHVDVFTSISYRPIVVSDRDAWQPARDSGLERARGVLQSMVDELEHYGND